MKMIDSIFPKARQRLLGLLLPRPYQEFYLRELVRKSGMGQGSVQQELSSLAKSGLILRRKDGNRVYYRANTAAPIYNELKALMLKTAGLADVLRDALKPEADKIDSAFVYGSVARGDETAESDIDLMVIGTISFRRLTALIEPAQEYLGREINPTVYSKSEFVRKIRSGHHFCRCILREPKLFILGEEDELKNLASSRLAG